MILLVDAGNTLVKWQVRRADQIVDSGQLPLTELDGGAFAFPDSSGIASVAVSTVVSEQRRISLENGLIKAVDAPVTFYWSEARRDGLSNAYKDVGRMGADRWHAMLGAWQECRDGFAVIDAGSAVTVDFVQSNGAHLGGYILPGNRMMLRSLQTDAARIGFAPSDRSARQPGRDTSECVLHGQSWLWDAVAHKILDDIQGYGINRLYVTGGDAALFDWPGHSPELRPFLVFDGLAVVHQQECRP